MAASIYESHKNGKFVAVIELFSGVSLRRLTGEEFSLRKWRKLLGGAKLSEPDLHILYGKDL